MPELAETRPIERFAIPAPVSGMRSLRHFNRLLTPADDVTWVTVIGPINAPSLAGCFQQVGVVHSVGRSGLSNPPISMPDSSGASACCATLMLEIVGVFWEFEELNSTLKHM